MTTYADWTDHPDADEPTIFWVHWKGKMRTNMWHATIDGELTLCHIGVRYPLYVGRKMERCFHCLVQVARRRRNEPE